MTIHESCRECRRSDADTARYTVHRREVWLCGPCAHAARKRGVPLVHKRTHPLPRALGCSSPDLGDCKTIQTPRVSEEIRHRQAQARRRRNANGDTTDD